MAQIDRKFMRRVEGFSLKGYVPRPNESRSGVTIATGFDIGQRAETDLAALPLDLRMKLRPYLDMRGPKALEVLRAKPLTIAETEADALDTLAERETLVKIRRDLPDFDALPAAVQTVAFSVAYQYGSLRTECPKFFALLQAHDWAGLYDELRDFGDDYHTRRWNEATYLKENL